MTKISQFPNGTAPTGTEKVPALQGGVNVLLTVQDIANRGTGGVFAVLSTSAWDFTTGTKKSKTLAANTAITISGSVAGQSVAILSVTQDATGSRTLSINGSVITINTAANSNTLIAVIDLGGGSFAFDTNFGGASGTTPTPPAGTTTDLTTSAVLPTSGAGTAFGAAGNLEWMNTDAVHKITAAGTANRFKIFLKIVPAVDFYINVWRLGTGTTYNRMGRHLCTVANCVVGLNEFTIATPFSVLVGDQLGVGYFGTTPEAFSSIPGTSMYNQNATVPTPFDWGSSLPLNTSTPIKVIQVT